MLNRRVGRLELFERPIDYLAFEKIFVQARHKNGLHCGRPKVAQNIPGLFFSPSALPAGLRK